MPIYEYNCSGCGLKFERLRAVSLADAETPCPNCQGLSRRAISVFASFSRGSDGTTSRIAGGAPSCSACSSTSCATCG